MTDKKAEQLPLEENTHLSVYTASGADLDKIGYFLGARQRGDHEYDQSYRDHLIKHIGDDASQKTLGISASNELPNNNMPMKMMRDQVPQIVVDPLMEVIAKMAIDPNADITKLERLIALRDNDIEKRRAREKEEKAEAAKNAYFRDFVTMKPNLPRVVKRGNNTHTKSKYALLEDINDAIVEVLEAHGFADDVRDISQTDKDVTGTLVLRHRDGYEETLTLTLPIDNSGAKGGETKTVVHGTASTISYLRRILLCTKLNISAGDDKDGNAPDDAPRGKISVEQAAIIDSLIRETDANRQEVLDFAGVTDVLEVPISAYAKIIAGLNARKRELDAKKAKSVKV